jgi:hypothetical protein
MLRNLDYYAKGRGFNARTVQTFVYEQGCYWVRVFSMYNMYVFTKKSNVPLRRVWYTPYQGETYPC